MVNSRTISDLNQAFAASPNGFLIVDQGQPSFAVLPYEVYKILRQAQGSNQKKIRKILVTGGAGYIGSHTVKLLADQDYEAVVLDNLSTGRKEAVGEAKLVVGDLADPIFLDRIIAEGGFDAVLHFAASVEVEESVANPGKYYQSNVVNGLNLLAAMLKHGLTRIVFSSSAAVYGEPEKNPIGEETVCCPTNPYGETKFCFENILKWYGRAYGLNSVSLRYFNAAGALPEAGLGYVRELSHTHLIPRVLDAAFGKKEEIEVFGKDYDTADGTCVRDYVHVLDLAQAHILALKKLESANGAYVYNVGTGKGYSVLEIIEEVMEVTGRMIPMKIAGRRAGDPARLVADSRKLQKELGWKPAHDLKSIIQSSCDWQKSA